MRAVQQANAQRQHHEGQGRDVEFLHGGDEGSQQESARRQRLLSVQGCEVGGYGVRKDGGRYPMTCP